MVRFLLLPRPAEGDLHPPRGPSRDVGQHAGEAIRAIRPAALDYPQLPEYPICAPIPFPSGAAGAYGNVAYRAQRLWHTPDDARLVRRGSREP